MSAHLCVVCLDNAREVRFACGHACCCQVCASKLAQRRGGCPICRATPVTIVDQNDDIAHEDSFDSRARRPGLLRRMTSRNIMRQVSEASLAQLLGLPQPEQSSRTADALALLLLGLLISLQLVPPQLSPLSYLELPSSFGDALAQVALVVGWWVTFTVASALCAALEDLARKLGRFALGLLGY